MLIRLGLFDIFELVRISDGLVGVILFLCIEIRFCVFCWLCSVKFVFKCIVCKEL